MERHCLRKKKKKTQTGREAECGITCGAPVKIYRWWGVSPKCSSRKWSTISVVVVLSEFNFFFLHSNFGTGYWETKPTWYPFAHIEWNLIAAIDNKNFSLCSGKGIKTSGALKTSNICAWQCAGNKSVIYPCDYIAAQRHQVHVIQNYILAVSH